MESKDKGSRTGSKVNLNESSVPLLDDDLEREKIELKEKASTNSSKDEDEKDDSKTEKQEGDGESDLILQDAGQSNSNDTKEKKKKKKKEAAANHQRTPSCVNTLSVGLNLLERDDKHNNDFVNIQFEDVICEPDSSHSFDAVWRLTFIIFSATKLWCYRLITAIVALPCAIFCGFNFALLTAFHVWALTPIMRFLEIIVRFLQRLWSLFFRALCDPVFQSIGMLCSNVNIHRTQQSV